MFHDYRKHLLDKSQFGRPMTKTDTFSIKAKDVKRKCITVSFMYSLTACSIWPQYAHLHSCNASCKSRKKRKDILALNYWRDTNVENMKEKQHFIGTRYDHLQEPPCSFPQKYFVNNWGWLRYSLRQGNVQSRDEKTAKRPLLIYYGKALVEPHDDALKHTL